MLAVLISKGRSIAGWKCKFSCTYLALRRNGGVCVPEIPEISNVLSSCNMVSERIGGPAAAAEFRPAVAAVDA